tara:strand:- start:250 stop:726 length:477 start_codon:yes stop_codon:yes gene_type:complete
MKYFLIVFSILFTTSIYSEGIYTDTVGWKENALVVFMTPGSGATCMVEKSMQFRTKITSQNRAKVGSNISFKSPLFKTSCLGKKKNSFTVRMIYAEKKNYQWMKDTYKNFKKQFKVKNLDSFKQVMSGYDKNNIYNCFMSWKGEKEPKYWISIAPCGG